MSISRRSRNRGNMATIRSFFVLSKLLKNPRIIYTGTRSTYAGRFSDEKVAMLKEFWRRKKEAGPEKLVHRNTWLDWNYPAELFAFSKRIGEDFAGTSLERAFTQRSYVLKQEELQRELGVESSVQTLEDNETLAKNGEVLTRDFVARYLRTALPYIPEESIQNIRDHLLSEDSLSFIISNIGADELILCTDFPTEKQTHVSTFYALVGAIEESSGRERAGKFVRDFVIASLSGQDLHAFIMPEDRLGILTDIFRKEGKEPPEPRIIGQSSMNTITPSYRVGLYSQKKHIATGDGESVQIAIQNAALVYLWKLWGIPDGRFQFPYNIDVSNVLSNNRSNVPLSEWTQELVYKAFSTR